MAHKYIKQTSRSLPKSLYLSQRVSSPNSHDTGVHLLHPSSSVPLPPCGSFVIPVCKKNCSSRNLNDTSGQWRAPHIHR